MILKPLTDALSVAAQIKTDDLEAIRAAGFRSIVCNRPDGESPDQTDWDTVATAARAMGMEVAWLPAETGKVTNALHLLRVLQPLLQTSALGDVQLKSIPTNFPLRMSGESTVH